MIPRFVTPFALLLVHSACICGAAAPNPLEPEPPSPPPMVDPRWQQRQRVGRGLPSQLLLGPIPTIATSDFAEMQLDRLGVDGWEREYVGPGSAPRMTGGAVAPAVFSAALAFWQKSPGHSYRPSAIDLPRLQTEGLWDRATVLTSGSSTVVFWAYWMTVHETATARDYEYVASALFAVHLEPTGQRLEVLRQLGREHMPTAPRAAGYDEGGVLHSLWSKQAFSDTFEHCRSDAPNCTTLKLDGVTSIGGLAVKAGQLVLVTRSGPGVLELIEPRQPPVVVMRGLDRVYDVAWGSDGSVHVVYSVLGSGERPWREQSRFLWYALRRDSAWSTESLGYADGPAALALDEENQPRLVFTEATEKAVAGGVGVDFFVAYAVRAPSSK